MEGIKRRTLTTLKDFYDLMGETRQVRFWAVSRLLGAGRAEDAAGSLKEALVSLQDVPERDGRRVLSLDGERDIQLDMDYELSELEKDILYLERGEEALLAHLAEIHDGFEEHLTRGRMALLGTNIQCLVTDRDGTINNYCARYLTSVQSIYNSVFLSRFARERVAHPVILTSAPLEGLIEVSVNPEGLFYYAASKGRECLDRTGVVRRMAIPADKQAAMDALNRKLTGLLARPENEKFTLIGSGLQFKFGQSTVARQDIGKSVNADESEELLHAIRALVAEVDPEAANFRIEDTGLDVEIILTVETAADGLKDFDKGDGVTFLNSELGLEMITGTNLICGDTGSDVPMLEAAMALNKDTRAVYVTKNKDLEQRIHGVCPDAVVVPEPDMLVAILGSL